VLAIKVKVNIVCGNDKETIYVAMNNARTSGKLYMSYFTITFAVQINHNLCLLNITQYRKSYLVREKTNQ